MQGCAEAAKSTMLDAFQRRSRRCCCTERFTNKAFRGLAPLRYERIRYRYMCVALLHAEILCCRSTPSTHSARASFSAVDCRCSRARAGKPDILRVRKVDRRVGAEKCDGYRRGERDEASGEDQEGQAAGEKGRLAGVGMRR